MDGLGRCLAAYDSVGNRIGFCVGSMFESSRLVCTIWGPVWSFCRLATFLIPPGQLRLF